MIWLRFNSNWKSKSVFQTLGRMWGNGEREGGRLRWLLVEGDGAARGGVGEGGQCTNKIFSWHMSSWAWLCSYPIISMVPCGLSFLMGADMLWNAHTFWVAFLSFPLYQGCLTGSSNCTPELESMYLYVLFLGGEESPYINQIFKRIQDPRQVKNLSPGTLTGALPCPAPFQLSRRPRR